MYLRFVATFVISNISSTMKRIALVGWLLVIFLSVAWAQKGVIVFKSLDHQFGDVAENNGPLHHSFEFTNKGEAPVIVYGVSTSCGCTVSEWTKEPVLPGKKGIVTATFDPNGRPYSFSKTLTVNSNSEQGSITLTIRGYVIPNNATPQTLYAQRLADIGFRSFYQILGEISHTSTQKIEVPVHNFGTENKTVKITKMPKYMSGKTSLTLKPGETSKFQLELKAKKMTAWGTQSAELNFRSGEAVASLYLHFERIEDFSGLSPKQLANAAHLSLPESLYRFENVRSGEKVVRDFELKNTGKSPLTIRGIISNCSCLTYTINKETIPAGESATLTLTYDTTGYNGEQSRQLTLIVNDPTTPKQTIDLRGTIQ